MNSENWILNNENWILNYENWIRNNELDELSVWSCRFIMDEDKDTVLNLLRYQDVRCWWNHVPCTMHNQIWRFKNAVFPRISEKNSFLQLYIFNQHSTSLYYKFKISMPYICVTWWCKPLIFQTIWSNRVRSLKYGKSTNLGCKDIWIKNQSLWQELSYFLICPYPCSAPCFQIVAPFWSLFLALCHSPSLPPPGSCSTYGPSPLY